MGKRRIAVAVTVGLFAAGLVVAQQAGADGSPRGQVGVATPDHIVVIYEENHSFDNLYGLWGSVNGQRVNGVPQADLAHTVQVAQSGTPYTCLLQNDVNLTAPSPLTTQCIDPNAGGGFNAISPTCRSTSTPTSRPRRRPARRRVCSLRTACSTDRVCLVAAPRTWSIASTRSSTSWTAASRTGT